MYQFLQKNRTNINIFINKLITKIKNIIDIGLILISKSYSMLLSYDSDMVNKFENYIKSHTHYHSTKLLSDSQLIILVKFYCHFNKVLI